MSNQTVDFFSIRTLTNLHAGSGDTNYGIVDNMVQRDPASGIPVIHSSSLKGALRQHFTELEEKDAAGELTDDAKKRIAHIFGGETTPRKKGASGDDFSAGSHLFFEAKLLILPARSDLYQFFRAFSPVHIKEIMTLWDNLGYIPPSHIKEAFEFLAQQKATPGNPKLLSKVQMPKGFSIEDWEINQDAPPVAESDKTKLENAETLFGSNLVCLNSTDFKALCKKLPVIARNQLENGISQNLFYEEVVPRESRFFSFVVRPDGDNSFASKMKNTRVQVGANATIGYGQCLFYRFASEPKPQPQTKNA